jgi:predicted membrane channel-forming protein YqfA (hemolysin III family)
LSPSSRKLTGIAIIVLLILIWAALVASLAHVIGNLPILVQGAFYLVMGIVWISPLKPLIRWTETGRWRRTPAGD